MRSSWKLEVPCKTARRFALMGNRRARVASEGFFLEIVELRLERLEQLLTEPRWQKVGQRKMVHAQATQVISLADHIQLGT